MSWSSEISAFKDEVRNVQSQLEAIGSELTNNCKGIGEEQICQALSGLRDALEQAQKAIERMR